MSQISVPTDVAKILVLLGLMFAACAGPEGTTLRCRSFAECDELARKARDERFRLPEKDSPSRTRRGGALDEARGRGA